MNNSAANPATQLAAQKERLEGRLVKLGARKRGIVMLVEHNCSSFNAVKTNKKGKKVVNKHVTQATIVAWVIEDFTKAWMMEPGAKMDFDFAVAYDTDAFSDEDILEAYKRADERDDVEPVSALFSILYFYLLIALLSLSYVLQEVIAIANETSKKRKSRLPPRLKEGILAAIPPAGANLPDITVIEYHVSKVLRQANTSPDKLYQVLDHYCLYDINFCMFTEWKLWPHELKSKLYVYAACQDLFEEV